VICSKYDQVDDVVDEPVRLQGLDQCNTLGAAQLLNVEVGHADVTHQPLLFQLS